MAENKLKLMTYNIGGGRKDMGSRFDSILQIIKNESPDLLAIQEAVILNTLDGEQIDQPKMISAAGASTKYSFFGPTLSMQENFDTRKELFIHGIFNDWENWQQGNALFSRWPFKRLGNHKKSGSPHNLPLFKVIYNGSRETDPRNIVIAQIDMGFAKAFTLATHLTTLNGERGVEEISQKKEEAQRVRSEQCERILELTQKYIVEKNELAFLMGDFNAVHNEPAISNTLEKKGGFVRLLPNNKIGTHVKLETPVDHIFVFPGKYHIKYDSRICDDGFSASDHNPVVANITIFDTDTEVYKKQGKGVFQENIR
jgi:endonuclease/exonuclease/phosphatase family metal-dependent hydrolase